MTEICSKCSIELLTEDTIENELCENCDNDY